MYTIQTIQQYIRGFLKSIQQNEEIKINFIVEKTYVMIYFFFPQRLGYGMKNEQVMTDNGVKVCFYSSFYTSLSFPVILQEKEEILKM